MWPIIGRHLYCAHNFPQPSAGLCSSLGRRLRRLSESGRSLARSLARRRPTDHRHFSASGVISFFLPPPIDRFPLFVLAPIGLRTRALVSEGTVLTHTEGVKPTSDLAAISFSVASVIALCAG